MEAWIFLTETEFNTFSYQQKHGSKRCFADVNNITYRYIYPTLQDLWRDIENNNKHHLYDTGYLCKIKFTNPEQIFQAVLSSFHKVPHTKFHFQIIENLRRESEERFHSEELEAML